MGNDQKKCKVVLKDAEKNKFIIVIIKVRYLKRQIWTIPLMGDSLLNKAS